MTSSSFIKTVAEKNNLSQKAVREMANMFEAGILESLSTDNKFTFAGLIFKLKDVDERTGRNPQTGDEVAIPAHKRLLVKPSSSVKNSVKSL